MNPSRKVTLNHKTAEGDIEQIEVKMLYCAAAESGYQILSGNTMDVFVPELEQKEDGTFIVVKAAPATDMDYLQLSMAIISAAYEADNQESPITAIRAAPPSDVLKSATSEPNGFLWGFFASLKSGRSLVMPMHVTSVKEPCVEQV